jgi:guanine deaminase
VNLGLGTDNSGGYSSSIIDALRFSIATCNNVYLGKMLAKKDPKEFMDYKGAINMATRGSAKVCSLDHKVGGFDVGLQFDALRIKMSAKHVTELFGFETLEDMIHKFVFLGDDRNVVQVYVQGRCVKNMI